MSLRTRLAAAVATVIVAGTSLPGCGEGDMNPNPAPGVEAPGQGPSAGGSGTTPGESTDSHGASGPRS